MNMAHERPDLVGNPTDIIDPANGSSLRTEKVVDITWDCPRRENKRRKALLQFTTSQDELIVQMVYCYKYKEYGGNFYCAINSPELSERYGPFEYYASHQFGLTPQKLRDMIYQHAPQKIIAAS